MIHGISLRWRAIIAIVDIATDHQSDDSPRWDLRTISPLVERGIVQLPAVRQAKPKTRTARVSFLKRARLTKKGHAYLSMAEFEYKSAEAFLEAHAA